MVDAGGADVPVELGQAGNEALQYLGAAVGVDRADLGLGMGALAQAALGRDDHIGPVAKRDHREGVVFAQAVDHLHDRALDLVEAAALHGGGTVDDQAQVERRVGQLGQDGGLNFEQGVEHLGLGQGRERLLAVIGFDGQQRPAAGLFDGGVVVGALGRIAKDGVGVGDQLEFLDGAWVGVAVGVEAAGGLMIGSSDLFGRGFGAQAQKVI